eukprot:gene5947-7150_t
MASDALQYPAVRDTLLKNMLEMLAVWEEESVSPDEETDDDRSEGVWGSLVECLSSQEGQSGEGDDDSQEESGQEGQAGQGGKPQPGEGQGGGADGEQSLENLEIGMDSSPDADSESADADQKEKAAKAINEELAKRLMEEFKEQWQPAMENLEAAEKAFSGLDGLMDGPAGFDVTNGVWNLSGWREVDELRKKLESLKELRELVRELGRGSGKGPLKRARSQRDRARKPMGVVRSPLEPSETRGLTRSGDLSRMLPGEMSMLVPSASRASKLLFLARHAERTLLSYERSGWEEETAEVLDRLEIRPSANRGPIILCLDTSSSMSGGRETVAKALTLECMRQAHKEKRPCYLYAFSGPGDVEEMELRTDEDSIPKLLQFLSNSFNGGTDVDEPLWRALRRLQEATWADADVLLVTDGEIPNPDAGLIQQLDATKDDLGLKVHGLLVGDPREPEIMDAICSQVHRFTAWDKVKQARSTYGGY